MFLPWSFPGMPGPHCWSSCVRVMWCYWWVLVIPAPSWYGTLWVRNVCVTVNWCCSSNLGSQKIQPGGDMLCAATPKLSGNRTLWENCRCLLVQLCALDHKLKGRWVQKFSTSRTQSLNPGNIWCVDSKQHCLEPGVLDIRVEQTSNLRFRHLSIKQFNFSPLPKLIKLSEQGCSLLKIHLVKTFGAESAPTQNKQLLLPTKG